MKRLMAILLAALLLMGAQAALAEEAASNNMQVINCDEWVSLRASADASSERLSKVPAGALVMECEPAEQGFIRCQYQGVSGYIMAKYLTPAEAVTGPRLMTTRQCDSSGERMHIDCYDNQGALLWQRDIASTYATELDMTAAFVAGTAEQPCVALFAAGVGLTLADGITGQDIWTLSCEEAGLSGGLCWATGEDGTMYIGGYYGPDPVAISMAGEVLWQSQPSQEAYWLYEIALTDEGVVGTYSCIGEHAAPGRICYSYAGEELWVKMD